MDADWERLAGAIQARRQVLNLSQQQLANAAGVARTTVKNLEGARTPTRLPSSVAAIERELGWKAGSARAVLAGGEPTLTPNEPDLEGTYLREPVSEGDLVGLIHNVVFDAVIATAPDTPLSEVRKIEERALEMARRAGFGPPRKRAETHTEDDPGL
jgi:transcriptional regulator with XRE-family HTH domain